MGYIRYILILSLICCMIAGCKTGIESTKTITLSKSDRRQLEPTAEEKLMDDLRAPVLSTWEKGKRFLISDNRVQLVFDSYPMGASGDSLAGKIIEFEGVTSKATPGGSDEAVIVFRNGADKLYYSTGKTPDMAMNTVSSMDVPMVIDLDLVALAGDLLTGRKVWTRSQLWYDANEEKIEGRKFVPVDILKVEPGGMVFPLKITIRDENGNIALMFMNVGKVGMESRTFQTLFSLTDPKDKYPGIQADVWKLIQQGRVRPGMTKDECKLSLGNPDDVNSGHDWNSTIDLWQYSNGRFLRFQDGLLVDYK